MPRIYYDLDDELHRRAKAAAAMRGTTLKQLIIDALEAAVAAEEREQARGRRQ